MNNARATRKLFECDADEADLIYAYARDELDRRGRTIFEQHLLVCNSCSLRLVDEQEKLKRNATGGR